MRIRLAALLLLIAAWPAVAQQTGVAVPGPDQSPDAAKAQWMARAEKLKLDVSHLRPGPNDLAALVLSVPELPEGQAEPGQQRLRMDKATARNLVAWLAKMDFFATAHTQKWAQIPIGPTSYRIGLMAGDEQVSAIYSQREALAMLAGLRAVLAGGGPAEAPKDWRKEPDGGLMCPQCKGKMFIMSIGKCSSCGGQTSSGGHKLCSGCSGKQGKCKACGKEMPKGGNAAAGTAMDKLARPLADVREETDAMVDKLIDQLGDDNYRTRKAASDALAKLGYAARDRLQAALKRDGIDLETRGRLEELLAALPAVNLRYGKQVMTADGITIRIAEQFIEAVDAEGKIMWRTRLGQESEALRLTDKGVVVEPSGAIIEPKTGRVIQAPNQAERR